MKMNSIIKFSKLNPAVITPKQQTKLAAGYDVHAYLEKPVLIKRGAIEVIPTGLKVQLEKGTMLSVRPRSGLAFKHGITLVNSPGTVDADFRGEIKIALINHGPNDYEIKPAERIAQFILEAFITADWKETELEQTERGEQGFGSTGTR